MALKKTKGFLYEFKEFAARGNVVDMAVGVVIGAAFGKITSSLVDDIFMPLISALFGAADFTQWNITLRPETLDEAGAVLQPALTLGIGNFLGVIFNFLLVAFAMFLFVKFINRLRRPAAVEEAPAEEAPPELPAEQVLLTEIRDLLKEKQDGSKT